MEDDPASMSLAGSPLGEIRHVCALFNSDEEEYRVLLPFVKDGFSCGHKAVHIVNPGQRDEHRERLALVGIDPDAAEQRGQLEVRASTDTYLRDGRFDPDRMLEAFSRMASVAPLATVTVPPPFRLPPFPNASVPAFTAVVPV